MLRRLVSSTVCWMKGPASTEAATDWHDRTVTLGRLRRVTVAVIDFGPQFGNVTFSVLCVSVFSGRVYATIQEHHHDGLSGFDS